MDLVVPFSRPSIGSEEKKAVCRVLDSLWLTTGQVTHDFEREFANFIGAKYALAVNSNTNGMLLAMEACGVRAGTAVITTPYTFVSTAACALHLGAEVIFCDIEKESFSIDCNIIEEILKKDFQSENPKVKAIVPVHIGGVLCDMQKILALAKKYSNQKNKIYVIEDAAHSFPSKTSRGFSGTLADAAVFSFYVTKPITTGEGGMVTTADEKIFSRIKKMRLHGMSHDAWNRYGAKKSSFLYDIEECGYKANLPDLLSAIGLEQLKKAADFLEKRKKIAQIYNKEFSSCDFLRLPPDGEGNSWHLYLIQIVREKLKCTRDEFASDLQNLGVGISVHFRALFEFSYWKRSMPNFCAENFPNAKQKSDTNISLPIWPGMTENQIDFVISAVKKIGEKYAI